MLQQLEEPFKQALNNKINQQVVYSDGVPINPFTRHEVDLAGITPEEIMIATFTEKAAKELVTRITNELLDRKININVNEMYIGTFHSICLRIIKEHLEYTRIKKNYRTLDSFDQQYMIFQNINEGINSL